MLLIFVHWSYFPTSTSVLNGLLSHIWEQLFMNLHYTIIDWWWGQHMICWTWRQNVARGRRPRATFCLKVQHIICCPNPQSIIVLLYLHWLRITYTWYSIKPIHKQTLNDQTGLNLDELIWDELALVWINSYTITPVHVIQIATNKLTQLETNWFRTKWIQNESTCLWRQTRHSVT